MSVENNIFLQADRLPSAAEWQQAITEEGFDVWIDPECDTATHEGFWPCKYRGQDCGFEYWTEEVSMEELIDDGLLNKAEAETLEDRKFLVTLETRSNLNDAAVSAIAAAAMTRLADGMFAEGGEPPFIASSESVDWAKKAEIGFLELISEQNA